jgi:hypothetical protein
VQNGSIEVSAHGQAQKTSHGAEFRREDAKSTASQFDPPFYGVRKRAGSLSACCMSEGKLAPRPERFANPSV